MSGSKAAEHWVIKVTQSILSINNEHARIHKMMHQHFGREELPHTGVGSNVFIRLSCFSLPLSHHTNLTGISQTKTRLAGNELNIHLI